MFVMLVVLLLVRGAQNSLFDSDVSGKVMVIYNRGMPIISPEPAGMFSEFHSVLGALSYAEKHGAVGVRVNFNSKLYLSPEHGNNWWQYFFEPAMWLKPKLPATSVPPNLKPNLLVAQNPHFRIPKQSEAELDALNQMSQANSEAALSQADEVHLNRMMARYGALGGFGGLVYGPQSRFYPKTYAISRVELYKLIQRYMRVVPAIRHKVDAFKQKNYPEDVDFVMAVHYRGTDTALHYPFHAIPYSRFFDEVDGVLGRYGWQWRQRCSPDSGYPLNTVIPCKNCSADNNGNGNDQEPPTYILDTEEQIEANVLYNFGTKVPTRDLNLPTNVISSPIPAPAPTDKDAKQPDSHDAAESSSSLSSPSSSSRKRLSKLLPISKTESAPVSVVDNSAALLAEIASSPQLRHCKQQLPFAKDAVPPNCRFKVALFVATDESEFLALMKERYDGASWLVDVDLSAEHPTQAMFDAGAYSSDAFVQRWRQIYESDSDDYNAKSKSNHHQKHGGYANLDDLERQQSQLLASMQQTTHHVVRFDTVVTNWDSPRVHQGGTPLHFSKGIPNYNKGESVVMDSLLMSQSDYLIKGRSSVSEGSLAFNPFINYSFILD